jgi:hypothetical protein
MNFSRWLVLGFLQFADLLVNRLQLALNFALQNFVCDLMEASPFRCRYNLEHRVGRWVDPYEFFHHVGKLLGSCKKRNKFICKTQTFLWPHQ